MHTTGLLLTALLTPLLVTSTPILHDRAGGPSITPLPANCTVLNPLPHANCGTANVNGWAPSTNFYTAHKLYESYFEGFLPAATQAKQCKQQCYGYGNKGECKSSLVAYRVPVPKGYFGTAGGQLETACLLFDRHLTPASFVEAEEGTYVNATAASIYCPE